MSRLRALGAFLLVSILIPLAPSPAQDKRSEAEFYYEVWGTSASEPNRQRPWSNSFDTLEEAQARLQNIQRDHAPGGLLAADADKPMGLRVRKISRSDGSSSTVDAIAEGDPANLAKLTKSATETLGVAARVKAEVERAKLAVTQGQTVRSINNWGKVLADFASAVKLASQNASTLRDFLQKNVNTITKSQFEQAGKLVAEANRFETDLAKFQDFNRSLTKEPEQKKAVYTVFVYENVNNNWAKRDERTLVTDDMEKARSYVESVNQFEGWTATSNLPEAKKAIRPTLAVEKASSDPVVGHVWRMQQIPDMHHVFHADGTVTVYYSARDRRKNTWKRLDDNEIATYDERGQQVRLFVLRGTQLIEQDANPIYWIRN